MENKYGGNVLFDLSYDEFKNVNKNIHTTSGFFSDGKGFIELTDSLLEKIKKGDIIITEYQDLPLGEIIYLEAKSTLN